MSRNPFKDIRRAYLIGGAIILVVLLGIGANVLFSGQTPSPAAPSETSHVSVASVQSLSANTEPLQVTGTVTSLSQATILSQTSGQVVELYHALGDHVAAGELIAAFDNASQQAAVTQAEGALAAAQASYAKVLNTTAVNSNIGSNSANTGVANARVGAVAALQGAYASLDDAVHTRADLLFTNPRTTSPGLVITVPDSTLTNRIINERIALESSLANASALGNDSATGDVDADSAAMIQEARSVVTFLNDLVQAVNETPPSQSASASTLSGYAASLATARTEASGAISSVTAAKGAYDSAAATASTSANTATGGTTSDIASAAAGVKQAQGALAAAQAALEKTYVRSPINGTIVSLPITQGDFVSQNAQVAIVSNPGALYVDVEVTPGDAKTLAIDGTANINGTASGVITFIAPALDPTTGKIEVKVGITGGTNSLTDGETVSLALTREQNASSQSQNGQISIPIIATKIAPEGPEVFTVTASSTLTAHPITLGSILGDRVVVVSGLTPDMAIVTDARGLSAGQAVVVDSASSTPAASSTTEATGTPL